MGSSRVRRGARLLSIGAELILLCGVTLHGTQPAQEPSNPVLIQRPASPPRTSLIREGKIKLDVVVSDAAGKPVLGLEPWDFKILDNNQPRKVLSFRGFDGTQVMPDPPVQAILVIDTVNLPFQEVAFVRQQVERFLKQNGGYLKVPTTLALLSNSGVSLQSRPSVDGNAVATVVNGISGMVRTLDTAMGGEGMVQRFQLSLHNVAMIAENEARRPGRKLLIWVGPGWPMLNRSDLGYAGTEQKRWFASIVELATILREGQMSVYSVAPAMGSTSTFMYQAYMKGVSTYKQADSGNLALKVLSVQSGGLTLGPDNDLVNQLNHAFADANAYYQISFDPPAAAQADEYHELKVVADKPGTVVRTTTGYYNQPASQ